MLLTTIRSSWLRIPWWLLSLCFIAIFVGNIDMLIALITYLASFSIVILMFAMIVLVALHVYIHFLTWCNIDSFRYRLIWHVGSLACISSWSSLSMMYICITFYLFIMVCVDMNDMPCTLLDCMLHDCPPSAWLHVACLCWPHVYPLTSNSLGFGHSFHLGSHYCKCETFYVLALWPS